MVNHVYKKKNIFLNNCWFTLPVFKNKNLLPFYSKKKKKNAQPRFEPRPSTLHKLTTPRRAHLTTALSLHVLPEVLFGIYIVASSKNKLKVIFLKLQKKNKKKTDLIIIILKGIMISTKCKYWVDLFYNISILKHHCFLELRQYW